MTITHNSVTVCYNSSALLIISDCFQAVDPHHNWNRQWMHLLPSNLVCYQIVWPDVQVHQDWYWMNLLDFVIPREMPHLNLLYLRKFVFCFLIDVWINSKRYLNVSELILKYLQNLSSSLSNSPRRLWNSPKHSRLELLLCTQKRLFLVKNALQSNDCSYSWRANVFWCYFEWWSFSFLYIFSERAGDRH